MSDVLTAAELAKIADDISDPLDTEDQDQLGLILASHAALTKQLAEAQQYGRDRESTIAKGVDGSFADWREERPGEQTLEAAFRGGWEDACYYEADLVKERDSLQSQLASAQTSLTAAHVSMYHHTDGHELTVSERVDLLKWSYAISVENNKTAEAARLAAESRVERLVELLSDTDYIWLPEDGDVAGQGYSFEYGDWAAWRERVCAVVNDTSSSSDSNLPANLSRSESIEAAARELVDWLKPVHARDDRMDSDTYNLWEKLEAVLVLPLSSVDESGAFEPIDESASNASSGLDPQSAEYPNVRYRLSHEQDMLEVITPPSSWVQDIVTLLWVEHGTADPGVRQVALTPSEARELGQALLEAVGA